MTQRADSSEPGPVKVIDFGLAKILDGQGSSRGSDGLLIGTPEYLAPEAWRGISSEIDARSDQWSLAVLTYRMLAGRLPFETSSDTVMLARAILGATPCPLRQLIPDLPPAVEAAVTQALAKDKELRFRSVLDFIRALHGLPLSGAVQLRRDPATALLDYRACQTAALLDCRERPLAGASEGRDRPAAAPADYGDRLAAAPADYRDGPPQGADSFREQPTAALVDYHDQLTHALGDYSDCPTVARLRVGSSSTQPVFRPPPPGVESTARLTAVPVLQTEAAPAPPWFSAQTPARIRAGIGRIRRWLLLSMLIIVTAAVAHSLSGWHAPPHFEAAAPRPGAPTPRCTSSPTLAPPDKEPPSAPAPLLLVSQPKLAGSDSPALPAQPTVVVGVHPVLETPTNRGGPRRSRLSKAPARTAPFSAPM